MELNTQVEREITIHSSMAHPHVVDFYAAFEDFNFIYLVLEYAEGVSATGVIIYLGALSTHLSTPLIPVSPVPICPTGRPV